MSDNNNPVVPAETPAEPVNPVKALNDEVANVLGDSAPTVRKRLIDARVEKEIEKRVKMVTDGMERRSVMDKELKKVKPLETFDVDGKVVNKTYTQEQVKTIRETREKLKNLDAALVEALESAKYEKLQKCLEQKAPTATPDKTE